MVEKVTKEFVKDMLATNDRAVERALLVLVEYQTRDEQQIEHTNEENGEGFSKSDAKMMTSMAMQVKHGKVLSAKQLAWLRSGKSARFPSRIGKYAGQLARHANKFPKQKKEG